MPVIRPVRIIRCLYRYKEMEYFARGAKQDAGLAVSRGNLDHAGRHRAIEYRLATQLQIDIRRLEIHRNREVAFVRSARQLFRVRRGYLPTIDFYLVAVVRSGSCVIR